MAKKRPLVGDAAMPTTPAPTTVPIRSFRQWALSIGLYARLQDCTTNNADEITRSASYAMLNILRDTALTSFDLADAFNAQILEVLVGNGMMTPAQQTTLQGLVSA